LLDTHALLRWMLGDPRLPKRVAALLAQDLSRIVVSAVCGHEIATKSRLGKLAAPPALAKDLDHLVAEMGWEPLSLSIAHAQLAGRLKASHRDPFDRMLAAQAQIERLPLVTGDKAFSQLEIDVIW
jgi:PIN domain nuclease of toxin-antitoxin system